MAMSFELVDLVDSGGKLIDGLASVISPASTDRLHERAVLEQAKTFRHVDYVLFRRFGGEKDVHFRSSQVAAYVVDNSQQRLSEDELARLHHQLWLQGVAPLISTVDPIV